VGQISPVASTFQTSRLDQKELHLPTGFGWVPQVAWRSRSLPQYGEFLSKYCRCDGEATKSDINDGSERPF
jgi:hypothetical protein